MMNVKGERFVESAKLRDGWLLWMDADVEGSYFFVLFVLLHVLFVCRLSMFDGCNSVEQHRWVGLCDGMVL